MLNRRQYYLHVTLNETLRSWKACCWANIIISLWLYWNCFGSRKRVRIEAIWYAKDLCITEVEIVCKLICADPPPAFLISFALADKSFLDAHFMLRNFLWISNIVLFPLGCEELTVAKIFYPMPIFVKCVITIQLIQSWSTFYLSFHCGRDVICVSVVQDICVLCNTFNQ